MHEEDTTCAYCGQQFLPSLIEEHEEKCESKDLQGDMLDYLKDEQPLYTVSRRETTPCVRSLSRPQPERCVWGSCS